MKKLFFLSLFIGLSLASCKKKDAEPTPEPTTKLELSIVDNSGAAIGDANISLYKSEQAYMQSVNAVGKYGSNAQGKCLIDNLEPIKYWIDVTDKTGALNNLNTKNQTDSALVKGTTTKATIVLK